MNVYTYTNSKTGQVVGVIKAKNILQADQILKESTGLNPVKATHIKCEIIFSRFIKIMAAINRLTWETTAFWGQKEKYK
jgi:hypothetical protein